MNQWPENVKLAWAMPHTMSVISTATHYSLFAVKRPPVIEYLGVPRGGDIAEKRERQTHAALEMGCTHIWFIDGDMVFHPDILVDLFSLLGKGASLAGGLCYRGYPPWEPVVWHPTEKRMLLPVRDFDFGAPVEARATGAACLLVKREVFDVVERPWFMIRRDPENYVRAVEGEDFYFTSRATALGFKLLIHTAYDVDHIRDFPVNREIFFMSALFSRLLGKEKRWDRITKLWKKTTDPEWIDSVLNERKEE